MKKGKDKSGRLGGVIGNRLEEFKPSKENSHALKGRMEWNGGNNSVPGMRGTSDKARY